MKRTIFAPLMWLSITIIIVCAAVMGIVHTTLLNRYILSSKINTMLQSAERISQLTDALSGNYSKQLESFYILNLDLMSQSSQSHIIITDTKGNIVNFSTQARKFLSNTNISIKDFSEVLSGKNVYKIGPFNNMFGQKMFTVAVPIGKKDNVDGIVFLNSPVPAMYKDKYTLFTMLAISILVSFAVAFTLSYIMSKKIIRPIRDLSHAANDLAKGNYAKRVEISDVEELSELGTAFNTMAEAIENHEKVRTAFIGNVSHDLRTPMTTISGFIEGILDGTIPQEQQSDYLKIVLSESKRLSELVRTFLDISKYEENKVVLKKTSFDIIEMIRVVLISFEARIEEKKIHVNFEFENENTFVYADENEIHRVVMNLLDNAVKFVEEGGNVEVKVTSKGTKTLISVSNTGAGISDTDKKYIWGRFYKTDKSRTDSAKGFGLGLFIVKSIINQHGERIVLDNYDNLTKFIFTLPSVK